jgi:hypothetical protein
MEVKKFIYLFGILKVEIFIVIKTNRILKDTSPLFINERYSREFVVLKTFNLTSL